jgi:apolipoprotein D and lipocalin family protein
MKYGSFFFLALILGSFGQIACAEAPLLPDVQTVDYVDLTRYSGKWYQIAFFPTKFQGACTLETTATYGLRTDGRVSVLNECKTPSGKSRSISGTARIVDRDSNAKLKVKFFWFAPAGDYWILYLDKDYKTAVVGAPSRKFLWFLARSPSITKAQYEALVKVAESEYFDVTRLELTSTLLPN